MGKQWKQWQILFSWAPKSLQTLTAARKLKDAPWKKSYEEPKWHIKKQRHHFADKGPYRQSYGFSSSHVQMWELDRKEELMFSNCGVGGLLRVPRTARRSNQCILKEISLEYSLEGLRLKFQYFGYLMRRANTLKKTLMLGKIEGGRRRGRQSMRWLDGISYSMDTSLRKEKR